MPLPNICCNRLISGNFSLFKYFYSSSFSFLPKSNENVSVKKKVLSSIDTESRFISFFLLHGQKKLSKLLFQFFYFYFPIQIHWKSSFVSPLFQEKRKERREEKNWRKGKEEQGEDKEEKGEEKGKEEKEEESIASSLPSPNFFPNPNQGSGDGFDSFGPSFKKMKEKKEENGVTDTDTNLLRGSLIHCDDGSNYFPLQICFNLVSLPSKIVSNFSTFLNFSASP